jgi:hypothetical protein
VYSGEIFAQLVVTDATAEGTKMLNPFNTTNRGDPTFFDPLWMGSDKIVEMGAFDNKIWFTARDFNLNKKVLWSIGKAILGISFILAHDIRRIQLSDVTFSNHPTFLSADPSDDIPLRHPNAIVESISDLSPSIEDAVLFKGQIYIAIEFRGLFRTDPYFSKQTLVFPVVFN